MAAAPPDGVACLSFHGVRLPSPERLLDAAECACSVVLAIGLGHLLGADNISWAAITGYLVMRGHVAQSLLRGASRVAGTLAGAALALLTVPMVVSTVPAASFAAGAVGCASLYAALTSKRSYAWLLFGLTFEMMLLDKLQYPSHAILNLARTRVVEVCAGTLACIVVSSVSTVSARRRWPGPRTDAAAPLGWTPQAARHAAVGGLALALMPPLGVWFAIPQLAQGAVTIMAVMLVPVASVGAGRFAAVTRRLLQRAAGGVAGAALAAVILLGGQASAPLLLAGTVAGVVAGRLLESGPAAYAYAGLQFSVAVLTTLVPDHLPTAAVAPGLERLAGILVGLGLLEPALLVGRAVHLVLARIGWQRGA